VDDVIKCEFWVRLSPTMHGAKESVIWCLFYSSGLACKPELQEDFAVVSLEFFE
jgi:hypothetical protein